MADLLSPAGPEVVLAQGELWFGHGGRVGTLLGSCVAVALWHPVARVGGMCHVVLPSRELPRLGRLAPPRSSGPGDADLDGRYGDEAVALLLRHVSTSGTAPGDFDVALLGGGNQFHGAGAAATIDVAERNVAAVRALLAAAGFVVGPEHVGGSGPRRVVLDLTDGSLTVTHASGQQVYR